MKLSFEDFVKIHSSKLHAYLKNENEKYQGQSTSRVMLSRLNLLESRYDGLQELDEQASIKSNALILFLSAKRAFDRGLQKKGIKRLKQAEQVAVKTKDHGLLNQIYNLTLERAQDISDLNFEQLHQSILQNQEKLKQAQIRLAIFSELKSQFYAYLYHDSPHELEQLLENVVSKYTASLEDILDLKAIHQLISIYDTIGGFHHQFEDLDLFFENRLQYYIDQKEISSVLLDSLYLLANMAFRGGNFNSAKHYLTHLEIKSKHINDKEYLNRHDFLKSFVRAFEGKLAEAIVMIDGCIQNSQYLTKEHLNAHLAKVMYLFLASEYKGALSCLNELHHSDRTYQKLTGREWLIYKQIMNILLLYERQNHEIAESNLVSLIKKHRLFLNQKSSIGVFAYLKLIQRIIDGHKISPAQLGEYFDLHFYSLDHVNTDVFLKSFYAWAKAKIVRKDTYQVLLEITRQKV